MTMAPIPKILIVPTIAVCAFVAFRAFGARRKIVNLTLSALFFGWIGDILLIGPGDLYFLTGMVSFLIGHIFYVRCFLTLAHTGEPMLRAGGRRLLLILYLVVLAAIAGLVIRFSPQGFLFVPVLLYGFMLTTLIFSTIYAYGCRKIDWLLLCTLGAVLFTFSDALIGVGSFTEIRFALREPLIMPTYIAAQILLVAGIVLTERRLFLRDAVPAT